MKGHSADSSARTPERAPAVRGSRDAVARLCGAGRRALFTLPSSAPASFPGDASGREHDVDHEVSALSRRDVLMAAAGGAAVALRAVPASAQTTDTPAPGSSPATGTAPVAGPAAASGQVYEAVGGARTGIAGVMVSNGRDVALTDAAGRYTLPVTDETVLFVIKPSGYMTPVDPVTMLPRFYAIHQPAGSPAALGLTFEGIDPTGPLPASVDFALTRQDEPKSFEVVLFTDTQPESDAEVDFIREDIVSALAGTSAKFGLTAGDIMFDDLSMYGRLNRIIGTVGIPWYNVGGNHDFNFEAPGRRYSRETFKRVFGPPLPRLQLCRRRLHHARRRGIPGSGPEKACRHSALCRQARPRPARLRRQRAGACSGRQADRRRSAHPFADLPRPRCRVRQSHEPGRPVQALRGAALHGQLLGPYPHDRASLFHGEPKAGLHPYRTITTS